MKYKIHKLLFSLIFISQWGHAETCLNKKVDEVQIRVLIKEIIIDIEKSKVNSLAKKFNYPISMYQFTFENEKDFIEKWNKNRILSSMNLKHYDEDDKYMGTTKANDAKTMKIHYTLFEGDRCETVQFAITPGLMFNVKEIANSYKIVSWSSVY